MSAPAAPSRRVAWFAAIALASAAAAWNAWRNRGQVFGPLQDETLLVPIALRHVGLASYAGDRWLAAVAPIFSIPYSWIVGTLLRFIDDPVVALRWLALPFHVVFLAGTWRLVERFAGVAAAALVVVLCVLAPFDALVLAPGAALPRDLVFALLPWFVAALVDASPRRSFAVFFALGVVANLHPLTAIHAVMWFLLLGLVGDPSIAGVRRAATNGVAFGVGAAPYVFQYLSRPAVAGAVDPTVYAWRLESMAGETFGAWAQRMEPLLWLAAAVVVLGLAARRGGDRWPRTAVLGAASALVLAAIGPTIGRFVPALRGFQFGRFERFAYWCAVAGLACGALQTWRSGRFTALAAGLALSAVATAGPLLLSDASGRGPIGRVARWIDRRAGVPFEPPRPFDLDARYGIDDPTNAVDRDDFLAVCAFARNRTPNDALFLVPPETWGPFRVYARRGVVVTRKEGGAALSFLGVAGMKWYRDYADAVTTYAWGAMDDELHLAEWKPAYVVLDRNDPVEEPPGPPVLSAGNFRVFDLRRK